MRPSLVAVPLSVRIWCAPESAVGMAMLCTKAPVVVYSSRNTAVAEDASAAEPVPTLRTTRLPGVNAAPIAPQESAAETRPTASEARREVARMEGSREDFGPTVAHSMTEL